MRHYVMIGAPVTTVRTPPLLERELAAIGVAAEVQVRHVEPAALGDFMRGVRDDAAVDGLLVTMPHKAAVVAWLDGLTDTAARLSSVNTVRRTGGGRLIGAQFDGLALVRALALRGIGIRGKRVALLGTGAAGTAIALAVAEEAPAALDLVDLDPERARLVALTLQQWTGSSAGRALTALGDAVDILVNASPVGMRDGDPCPVPEGLVRPGMVVADIVADPPRTALAAHAEAVGAVLVTGRQMVEAQVPPIARWLTHGAAAP